MTSPAFSFYAKDWLAATMAWPLEARGAYVTLLAYQWDAGSIPAGDAAVARLLGVSIPKARDLWTILRDKFTAGPDGTWRNARLDLERAKQQDRHQALRDNGAKGGRPRKPNGNQNDNQNETYRFLETEPNGNLNESLTSSSSSSFASSVSPPPKGVPLKNIKGLTRFVSLGGRSEPTCG
jgi:uncharacterized protein YdaU (DUF1376 family)